MLLMALSSKVVDMLVFRLVFVPTWKLNTSNCCPHSLISMLADESRMLTILRLFVAVSRTLVVWKYIESFVIFLSLHFFKNKSPTCLNGQHSIQNVHRLFSERLIFEYQQLHHRTNRRPMGHSAHLRKLFNWINTYDYNNVD